MKQEIEYPLSEQFRHVKKPVLILHGDKDVNVPLVEAYETQFALQALFTAGGRGWLAGHKIALTSKTMQALRTSICGEVINTYGTTETGSWGGCTVMLPEDYAATDKLESYMLQELGVEHPQE